MVLHALEQRRDGLVTEVAPGTTTDEGVGLVDEQHAAEGPVDDFVDLGRGLPDVARDETAAVGLDEMPLRQHAERVQDPRQQPRHRGLAGARVPDDDEVPCRRRARAALVPGAGLRPAPGWP